MTLRPPPQHLQQPRPRTRRTRLNRPPTTTNGTTAWPPPPPPSVDATEEQSPAEKKVCNLSFKFAIYYLNKPSPPGPAPSHISIRVPRVHHHPLAPSRTQTRAAAFPATTGHDLSSQTREPRHLASMLRRRTGSAVWCFHPR